MTTKEAVEHLCGALREDPNYYIGWQANIAMAFKDECSFHPDRDMHTNANNAAKNFLNNLIQSGETPVCQPYLLPEDEMDRLEGRVRRVLSGETIMGLLTRELSEVLCLIREVRTFRLGRSTSPVKE